MENLFNFLLRIFFIGQVRDICEVSLNLSHPVGDLEIPSELLWDIYELINAVSSLEAPIKNCQAHNFHEERERKTKEIRVEDVPPCFLLHNTPHMERDRHKAFDMP